MKTIKYFTLTFIILISLNSYAQDNTVKAESIYRIALEKLKYGELEKCLDLFEQAIELDPDNIEYPYKVAYIHYLLDDYDEALTVLKKLVSHKNVNDAVYDLMGDTYKEMENKDMAQKTYEKGLVLFPKSGKLMCSLGVLEYDRWQYNKAIGYFQNGIIADPIYGPNYFYVSMLKFKKGDRLMGLLYGEIFMNFERSLVLTDTMSRVLFNQYKKAFKFGSDGEVTVTMSENLLDIPLTDDTTDRDIGFNNLEYELMFSDAAKGEISITIESLNRIRKRFIENYFKNGENMKMRNMLYDWLNFLISEKYFEVYNYWLFKFGSENEHKRWLAINKLYYSGFMDWFRDNYIPITKTSIVFKKL